MENFDLSYLRSLSEEICAKQASFQFYKPNEAGACITYLPTKQIIYWPERVDTLSFRYEMEKYRSQERPKLRKGCKNYARFVRKDGKLFRVDFYVDGRLDVIHLAHFENNIRYCFPFLPSGERYPTYACAVRFENEFAVEEYSVSNGQIVHRSYQKINDFVVNFRMINYVPSGQIPVICKEIGEFTLEPQLTYKTLKCWSWLDDEKNKQSV